MPSLITSLCDISKQFAQILLTLDVFTACDILLALMDKAIKKELAIQLFKAETRPEVLKMTWAEWQTHSPIEKSSMYAVLESKIKQLSANYDSLSSTEEEAFINLLSILPSRPTSASFILDINQDQFQLLKENGLIRTGYPDKSWQFWFISLHSTADYLEKRQALFERYSLTQFEALDYFVPMDWDSTKEIAPTCYNLSASELNQIVLAFRKNLSTAGVANANNAWIEYPVLRDCLKGKTINLGTAEDPQYLALAKEQLALLFSKTLISKVMRIPMWENNQRLQDYLQSLDEETSLLKIILSRICSLPNHLNIQDDYINFESRISLLKAELTERLTKQNKTVIALLTKRINELTKIAPPESPDRHSFFTTRTNSFISNAPIPKTNQKPATINQITQQFPPAAALSAPIENLEDIFSEDDHDFSGNLTFF